MKTIKRRTLFTAAAQLAVAKPADKPAMLTGYALLWNVLSTDRGGYKVRLLPNSATFATPTLAFWHHDPADVIGNTANGTLRIMPDEVGVKVEIDLPNTTLGNDAAELVDKRYVTGFSFAMVNDPEGNTTTEAGETILNASAYVVDEITVTSIPSFTQTNVEIGRDDEPAYAAVRTTQSLRLQQFRFSSLRLPAGAEFSR